MSALAKKLHVHFDDDVSVSSALKIKSNDEIADRKKDASILNYTRDELFELAKNKLSLEPPTFPDDIKDADEKRKQKIKSVFKNADILKSLYEKDGVDNSTVMSKSGVANKNAPNIVNEQDRTDFQQLIAAAVSNAQHQQHHQHQKQQQPQQQHKVDYAGLEKRRRRIGSGRIVDNYHKENNNCFPLGMDARYMRNELFKESNDGKRMIKNWKTGNEFDWKMMSHASSADSDNTDTKSDEPEWANVGVSKSDIIELHGFDGPSTGDDEKLKSDNSSENASIPLPARSTPSKLMPTKTDNAGKLDDYFNFEDFLKLDLPSSVNGAREHDKSESRFSQWFNGQNVQNGSPNRNKIKGDFHDMAGSQLKNGTNPFFNNFQPKPNFKKMTTYPNLANASGKVRSVDELEADWCPNIHRTVTHSSQQEWNAFQYFLNQLNVVSSAGIQQQSILKSAQSNYLLNLINKNSENLHQHRWSQNVAMERPDAQLYLHRLVNGEITQLHLLQELNNPRIHQCDRETLIAVLNFCNENQQWLLNQQQQQLKYKEQMSQQLRQLQLWHLRNTQLRSPTAQELQVHTQNVMQNAVLKKQFEEQYRKLQNPKPNQPAQSKFPGNYKNQRYNSKPRYNQTPQDGLQFIQSQSKPLWARQNGNHHPTLPVYGINDGGHMLNNNSKYSNDLLTGAMQQVFGRNISPSNLPGAVDFKDDGIKVENN